MASDIQFETTGYTGLMPDMYALPGLSGVGAIFAVPVPGAVGTNDLNNAISIMELGKKDLRVRMIRKDFITYVSGGNLSFLPVFSENVIGYVQTRGFMLFDIKTGEFNDHLVFQDFLEMIKGVWIIDGPQRQFLFLCNRLYNEDIPGSRILQSIQFEGGKFKVLGERNAGATDEYKLRQVWTVSNGKIFIVDNGRRTMEVFDVNFKKTEHPIIRHFTRENNILRRVDEIVIHPTLPFAVLIDIAFDARSDYMLWLIDWRDPDNITCLPVFPPEKKIKPGSLQFSPDGAWFLYWDKSEGTPDFYIAPVLPTGPAFLGEPRYLGRVLASHGRPSSLGTGVWISEPLSYVVTDGSILYRWDFAALGLENGAFHGKAGK